MWLKLKGNLIVDIQEIQINTVSPVVNRQGWGKGAEMITGTRGEEQEQGKTQVWEEQVKKMDRSLESEAWFSYIKTACGV